MNTCILMGLFAHFMADFTFQTNYIAAKKAESYFGVFLHCVIVFITSLLAVLPWGSIAVPFALVLAVMHFGIDCHKLFYTKKYNPSMLEHFYIDQGLHVLTVLVLVFIFGLNRITPPMLDSKLISDFLKIGNALLIIFGANTIAIVLYMSKLSRDEVIISFNIISRFKNSICGLFFLLPFLLISKTDYILALGGIRFVLAIASLALAFYLNYKLNMGISKRDRTLKILFHLIWAIIIIPIFF